MAISNAQQAKQLLQDGGMLVKPGFGGARQGYRSAQAQEAQGRGVESGNTGGTTGGREGRIGGQYNSPEGRAVDRGLDTDRANEAFRQGLTKSLTQQSRRAARDKTLDFLRTPFSKFRSFLTPKEREQRPGGGANIFDVAGPVEQDDEETYGEDGIIPYFQRLGFPTEAAYLASLRQPMSGVPGATAPTQTMDLNRIAYRLMADGGFIDDEPRQAYGLGSIVKKAFKTVRKPFKAVTRAVKKVAKSPTGRLLLAVAAPYALGPAMAQSQFLAGLSAAQKAAVISGATTGITQLASGEDLDLKDIAVSAAIGGASTKMFPGKVPGKYSGAPDPTGVAGRARVASDVGSKTSLFGAGDALGGEMLTRGATSASDPSRFTALTKDVINPRGIGQAKESTGILQTLKDLGTKAKESKFTDILLRNKQGDISPMKSILLASALSGALAKKEEKPDEFSDTDRGPNIDIAAIRRRPFEYMAPSIAGSRFDFYAAEGGQAKKEPVAKKVMPLLDMGGMEKDYRAEGGFVPIGRMEKADDVPARLSKNEFVFTADAVRNAGDGNVDKGAEVMYNMMKNLEAGGDVSKESQGLKGARRMFQTSQRLEEVL